MCNSYLQCPKFPACAGRDGVRFQSTASKSKDEEQEEREKGCCGRLYAFLGCGHVCLCETCAIALR